MRAPNKRRSLIGLLYDNPEREFSISELMTLIKIQSKESAIETVSHLRKADAPIKTIRHNKNAFYKYGERDDGRLTSN